MGGFQPRGMSPAQLLEAHRALWREAFSPVSYTHLPGDGPDAVRFTIAGDQPGALHLYYVVERDHHPWSHGPLEFSRAANAFLTPPPGETTLQLACAYVASYLRRISEASRH